MPEHSWTLQTIKSHALKCLAYLSQLERLHRSCLFLIAIDFIAIMFGKIAFVVLLVSAATAAVNFARFEPFNTLNKQTIASRFKLSPKVISIYS